jgi:hypothetical protein
MASRIQRDARFIGVGTLKGEACNVIKSIKPETGMAIVFNHKVLHEGGTLGEG